METGLEYETKVYRSENSIITADDKMKGKCFNFEYIRRGLYE
jgi:hypothetical protein